MSVRAIEQDKVPFDAKLVDARGARKLGIEGRSKMNKGQLQRAVAGASS